MSWTITIDDGKPLELGTGEAVMASVAGILMGAGLATDVAETSGRQARELARQYTIDRRRDWRTPPLVHPMRLFDNRVLTLRSTDLPEDPARRCPALDSDGNHCGRSLNHAGEC